MPVRLGLLAAAASVGVLVAQLVLVGTHVDVLVSEWGGDFRLYQDATTRWLAGGSFYQPYQLAGPYVVRAYPEGSILYPPTILALLVPLHFLPALANWLIPLGIVAYVVAWARPGPWRTAGMALCLAWPHTLMLIIQGGPAMWMTAFVASAVRFGWPGALLFVKPSVAPFALIGIRSRGWWIAALGLLALSVLLLRLWEEYLRVAANIIGGIPWYWSWPDIPWLIVPLIARGRRGLRLERATVLPSHLSDAIQGADSAHRFGLK